MKGARHVDPPTISRRALYVWLGFALVLTGVQLLLAIGFPVDEPVWTDFAGAALAAGLAGQSTLHLLPQEHRARPWLWAVQIALLAFASLALFTSFVQLV